MGCSSCRCPAKVQAALFLAAEIVYAWLHLRPLKPLILAENAADEAFLRDFTTGTYFASELFLFCLLAFASPIRCSLHMSATSHSPSLFLDYNGLTVSWDMQAYCPENCPRCSRSLPCAVHAFGELSQRVGSAAECQQSSGVAACLLVLFPAASYYPC